MDRKKKVAIALVVLIPLIVGGGYYIYQNQQNIIYIGAKPFNEQYIVAHMAKDILEENGFRVQLKDSLGGTTVNYEALLRLDIHAYLEYTGTAYSVILNKSEPESWNSSYIYSQVESGLKSEDNVSIASRLGFSNDYAIAVKKSWADENGVSTLSDFEPYASSMTLGTDPEFATRSDGLPLLNKTYGYTFGNVESMEPTLMYPAIENGDVDAITAYTTDARVESYNLTLLEDDQAAFPTYEAILIFNGDFERSAELGSALSVLDGKLTTASMRALNFRYDVDGEEASVIARDFLTENGII